MMDVTEVPGPKIDGGLSFAQPRSGNGIVKTVEVHKGLMSHKLGARKDFPKLACVVKSSVGSHRSPNFGLVVPPKSL